MNEHIISEWNRYVSKTDIVFHLGDVVMNDKKKFGEHILPRLKGKIKFIKGNHDPNSISCMERCVVTFQGHSFELCHDPNKAQTDAKYVIHGHLHLTGARDYDFPTEILDKNMVLDRFGRIFYNVNLELHKFRPVLMNQIFGDIQAAAAS